MIKVKKAAAVNVADQRPVGYLRTLEDAADREDSQFYYFTVDDYAQLYHQYRGQPYEPKYFTDLQRQAQKLPRLVGWVARFQQEGDRGVGDTVERMLAKMGGRKIKHLMHLLRCDKVSEIFATGVTLSLVTC
jgi:hypothetical protein